MYSYVSPFDVRDNIKHFGKAYAFYMVRMEVGTVRGLYLMWVAIHMLRYDEVKYIWWDLNDRNRRDAVMYN